MSNPRKIYSKQAFLYYWGRKEKSKKVSDSWGTVELEIQILELPQAQTVCPPQGQEDAL